MTISRQPKPDHERSSGTRGRKAGCGLTRRRFLTISAAVAMVPGSTRADSPVARWTGYAMGARASMALVGVKQSDAQAIFAAVEAELDRLEDVFSLYRPGSFLSRLNRDGRLVSPPVDLIRLVRLSDRINRATAGAFDPTIQPLWQVYAAAAAQQRHPLPTDLVRTLLRTGWRHVRYDDSLISFARPGMALTFNGIAQGYIADRVSAMLRKNGFTDILIDMGEIAALGNRPDGSPWRVAIAAPDGTMISRTALRNRALATSAPLGTPMDRSGRIGHILNPRTGRPGGAWRLVSVSAPTAILADGLSTAFCLLPGADIDRVLAAHPGTVVEALA